MVFVCVILFGRWLWVLENEVDFDGGGIEVNFDIGWSDVGWGDVGGFFLGGGVGGEFVEGFFN